MLESLKESFLKHNLVSSIEFEDPTWRLMMQMFTSENVAEQGLFDMIEDRNTKFNRDRGLIERNYKAQEPKHRPSLEYFRDYGLLLPMSSINC